MESLYVTDETLVLFRQSPVFIHINCVSDCLEEIGILYISSNVLSYYLIPHADKPCIRTYSTYASTGVSMLYPEHPLKLPHQLTFVLLIANGDGLHTVVYNANDGGCWQ